MARRLTKKQKEALESLAELKQKEAEIKKEVKDKQDEIMHDLFGGAENCPEKYESESGKLTLVQSTETEVTGTFELYDDLKSKYKVTEIIGMMKFSVTDLKKQLGTKVIGNLAKKGLIKYKNRAPYYKLTKK